jgi:hypothetical protein
MEFLGELTPTIVGAHIGREGAFAMPSMTNASNIFEFDATLIGSTIFLLLNNRLQTKLTITNVLVEIFMTITPITKNSNSYRNLPFQTYR